eukprot:3044527-Rhodomonas_salina.2
MEASKAELKELKDQLGARTEAETALKAQVTEPSRCSVCLILHAIELMVARGRVSDRADDAGRDWAQGRFSRARDVSGVQCVVVAAAAAVDALHKVTAELEAKTKEADGLKRDRDGVYLELSRQHAELRDAKEAIIPFMPFSLSSSQQFS